MVGVPGKYKGCETCRLRRVKCDNQRPHCKRCLDGGRTCAGYERETVFIIGTIEDQGRCSSHPPRVVKGKGTGKKGAEAGAGGGAGGAAGGAGGGAGTAATATAWDTAGTAVTASPAIGGGGGARYTAGPEVPGGVVAGEELGVEGDEEPGMTFEITPTPTDILRPAWDDLVAVVLRGRRYRLQIAGQHTRLRGVVRRFGEDDPAFESAFVSLPAYELPDGQSGVGGEKFRLKAQCLVHLAAPDEGQGGTDSVCLFLYEHNTSSSLTNQPRWQESVLEADTVRRLGPEHFRSFPAHHFFARIYRPNAVMAALLNRTPTFLLEPQWLSTPFQYHPKAPLDLLLGILAPLGALLARADHALAQEHTLARRILAQELLDTCLDVELELSSWFSSLNHQSRSRSSTPSGGSGGSGSGRPLFWRSPSSHSFSNPSSRTTTPTPAANLPFANQPPLLFRDKHTALCLTYYWTALILFYPTIWRLYFAAVIEPVTVVDDTTTAATHSTTALPAQGFIPSHHLPSHHHPSHHQPSSYTFPHHYHPQQQQQQQHQQQLAQDMIYHQQHQQQQQHHPQQPIPGVNLPMNLTPLPISTLPAPPRLQTLDVMRYALPKVRELAGNVCRAMEFLLDNGWVQNDLSWGSLSVVERFFRDVAANPGVGVMVGVGVGVGGVDAGMGAGVVTAGGGGGGGMMGAGVGVGDGRVEVMWCEGFRERALARGRELQEAVAGRRWVDLATF